MSPPSPPQTTPLSTLHEYTYNRILFAHTIILMLLFYVSKNRLNIYLFRVLTMRWEAREALCHAAFIYRAVKLPIPIVKTSPVCGWEYKVRPDRTLFCSTSLTMSGRRILDNMTAICETLFYEFNRSFHVSLHHFYVFASAQYFPVLVFN